MWRRCSDWLTPLKIVCKVSWYYWHFGQIILCCGAVLGIGRCLAAPLASTDYKPIAGDSWHTVKMKNMSFIFWKKLNKLLGQPNISAQTQKSSKSRPATPPAALNKDALPWPWPPRGRPGRTPRGHTWKADDTFPEGEHWAMLSNYLILLQYLPGIMEEKPFKITHGD